MFGKQKHGSPRMRLGPRSTTRELSNHLSTDISFTKQRASMFRTLAFAGAFIGSAFLGSAFFGQAQAQAINLTVQAEDYVLFSDTTTGNQGGQYRSDDVDIEATTDTGGGYNLGWIDAGEWLTFNATVPTSGTYTVSYRVASTAATGAIQLETAGGGTVYGVINVPNTGGWQNWQTISHSVNLIAGQQLALVALSGQFNLNWFRITGGNTTPDIVRAEDYIAAFDTTTDNLGANPACQGGMGVDLEPTTDTGGGCNVGWTAASEWLTYDAPVPVAGTYTVSYRVASATGGGSIRLEAPGGSPVYGTINVPSTGGWQTWQTISHTLQLEAGTQLTLAIPAGGFNLNWFRITPSVGGPAPDFGPNVHIFEPSTPNLQGQIDAIYNAQQPNHFGPRRDAILFKPGVYNNLRVRVGFYTQVLGLGAHPDDVHINGEVRSNAFLSGDNSTQNFWRAVENLSTTPSLGIGNNTMQWAVSQAIPFRRVHVRGNIKLNQNNGWASGGWFSDVLIDGQTNSATQQQWLSRNTVFGGGWVGSNWNMMFVGTQNPPAGNFPTAGQRYTKIAQTPIVREKPYLFIEDNGSFAVRVPSLRYNSSGITWANGAITPGTTIPIEDFFLARPGDSAQTINAQLAAGSHILFTPGVYVFNQTLQVNNPNTVILGMGLPTLRVDNGQAIMRTADVGGITISGMFFDAGTANSPVLLEVGPNGASANHASNPTVLHDVFFRVGGAAPGRATVNLSINANHTIVDHTWIWRADHGAGVGWNQNPSAHGLWVNGNDVTIYGLFVEHYQNYQTVWNGNGGRVYFYQSEIPYDPPSQAGWNSPTGRGFASYKVADHVTSHEAWGLGVYSVFTNANIFLDRAIEVPNNPNVRIHNMITACLGNNGGIIRVINNTGGQTGCNASVTPTVTNYP